MDPRTSWFVNKSNRMIWIGISCLRRELSAYTNPIINFGTSFERDEFLDQPPVSEERACSVERYSSHDRWSCSVWRYASHACISASTFLPWLGGLIADLSMRRPWLIPGQSLWRAEWSQNRLFSDYFRLPAVRTILPVSHKFI